MSKEKFGFSTLSRLLGKKNKEKNSIKTIENTSQNIIINNKGHPQNNTILPLHTATTNAPFEQTFRITVLLPKDQLYVARLGARAQLKQLLQLVCANKLLSEDQFEFRDPIDSSQVYDLHSTIGTVGLSEIRLCNKNEQNYNTNFNSDDIVKLRSQITTTGRSSVSSSEPSSKNSLKHISRISPYSSTNSLNSMDSTGMHTHHASPISLPPSSGNIIGNIAQNKPPVAPLRKKRVAPRPPSQISVPEKVVLPPTTDWKRLDQKLNASVNGDQIKLNSTTNSPPITGLQRKEFSSSTPNLNSNGNPNLVIYGDIDLHESSTSIDCNGNKQTSHKKKKYMEQNGQSDLEQNVKLDMHNRSISPLQCENKYKKNYYGSVQNVGAVQNNKLYDTGSYLSLDYHQYENGGEFPKPSPRKSVNIKKKTSAPPPPPRNVASPPAVRPRESITNLDVKKSIHTVQNNVVQNSDSTETNQAIVQKQPIMNGNVSSEKQTPPDVVSYDGSQTSDISTEIEQSSRSASTLSMTSQSPSMLDEQVANLKHTTKVKELPKIPTSRIPSMPTDELETFESKKIETAVVDDSTILCIPAPPTFADEVIESTNELIEKEIKIPTTEITIEKKNEYQYDTDLVTEAFKDIDNIPDETIEITEEFAMEETIEVDIKLSNLQNKEVKEDVVIINSDIEDGYQGNKISSQTSVPVTLNSNENKQNSEIVEYEREKEDIASAKQGEKEEQETKDSIDAKEMEKREPAKKINNFDNLIMPDVTLKTTSNANETVSPTTPPPTPAVEGPIKIKTNERLYENRITLKLSNAAKFRKTIGRSDSFHTTSNCNDFNNPSSENDSESRSLSFLSLLASQRQEVRSQSVLSDHKKLENRKSTSDLTISELPNLQSLIVMKSILSSQNNLNKTGLNDNKTFSRTNSEASDNVMDSRENDSYDKLRVVDNDLKYNDIPKTNSVLRMNRENNEIKQINRDLNGSDDQNNNDEDEITKKWKYQGKPNINLSTWSERPKHSTDVTIKNEGDYIFGGATVRRTSSISKMQRNRMSMPSILNPISITMQHYISDAPKQSLPEVKLRRVDEERRPSLNKIENNHTHDQEIVDFRSTLRKSVFSDKLYSKNDKNSEQTINGKNYDEENEPKSFEEKTKTFGPVIVRRTSGLKETLFLTQKPTITKIKDEKSYANETQTNHLNGDERKRNSEILIPVRMQINEKALYDDSISKSQPFLRFAPNMNGNVIRRNTKAPEPLPKPRSTINTTTPTSTHETDPKSSFLAEIRKFDKKNLNRI